ncbi:hypothetical protein QE152_g21786 [Popillia japonica]|uniref:Uncharacterized protein n=1 Tax=Popillia japonica TaxID=7064 RepID=A0AAW1KPB9_POPJA
MDLKLAAYFLGIAPILQKAIKSLSCSTITNGFKACGLFPWNSDALDYSKCLGHNHNKQIIDIPQDSKTLQYDEFCEIIGPQKLAELRSFNENDVDENFQLLVKIFTKLEPTQINVEQVILKETDPILIVDEMEFTNIPNWSQHRLMLNKLY